MYAPPSYEQEEVRGPPRFMGDRPSFAGRRRYRMNDATQGMGDRDNQLEKELYGGFRVNTGIKFKDYESVPVKVSRGPYPPPVKSENLTNMKYAEPTPVQRYAIPMLLENLDLMACAQTGSGKTAAFLLPNIEKLYKYGPEACRMQGADRGPVYPSVLIVCPTRELAAQIETDAQRFTYRSWIRTAVIYGRAEMRDLLRALRPDVDILVATPGKLKDFIQKNIISLANVKCFIMDEADRMLDMGFHQDIDFIVKQCDLPKERQTLMFSATFPASIRRLAKDYLRVDHRFLSVGRVGGTSNNITQKIVYASRHQKREMLLESLKSRPCKTLIFVETKREVDNLWQYLADFGVPATSIHGDRSQDLREDALIAFEANQCPVMVATAVVARGIDVPGIDHVINYDLPKDLDEYIHRIGRTGRAGNSGFATSFYSEYDDQLAPSLTRLLVECKQQVPEFLIGYAPPDVSVPMFNDYGETDDVEDETFHHQYTPRANDSYGGGGQEDSNFGERQQGQGYGQSEERGGGYRGGDRGNYGQSEEKGRGYRGGDRENYGERQPRRDYGRNEGGGRDNYQSGNDNRGGNRDQSGGYSGKERATSSSSWNQAIPATAASDSWNNAPQQQTASEGWGAPAEPVATSWGPSAPATAKPKESSWNTHQPIEQKAPAASSWGMSNESAVNVPSIPANENKGAVNANAANSQGWNAPKATSEAASVGSKHGSQAASQAPVRAANESSQPAKQGWGSTSNASNDNAKPASQGWSAASQDTKPATQGWNAASPSKQEVKPATQGWGAPSQEVKPAASQGWGAPKQQEPIPPTTKSPVPTNPNANVQAANPTAADWSARQQAFPSNEQVSPQSNANVSAAPAPSAPKPQATGWGSVPVAQPSTSSGGWGSAQPQTSSSQQQSALNNWGQVKQAIPPTNSWGN